MCDERLGWFGQCDQKSSRIVARKRCSLLSACRQLVWVAKITAPGRLARSFRMKIAIPPAWREGPPQSSIVTGL